MDARLRFTKKSSAVRRNSPFATINSCWFVRTRRYMTMDFHTFSRKQLQGLCKKNRIPANTTNVAMADSLAALDKVEGLDDLTMASTPNPSRTQKTAMRTACLTSTGKIQARPQEKIDSSEPACAAASQRRKQPVCSSAGNREGELIENGGDNQVISGGKSNRGLLPASNKRAYHTRNSARLLAKGIRSLQLETKEEASDGDELAKEMAMAAEKQAENTMLEISLPATVEETNYVEEASLPPSEKNEEHNNGQHHLSPLIEESNCDEALLLAHEDLPQMEESSSEASDSTEPCNLPTEEHNSVESSHLYINESYCSEDLAPATEQTRLPQMEGCDNGGFSHSSCLPVTDQAYLTQTEECNDGESIHAYIEEDCYCTKASVTATEQTHLPQTEECNNGGSSHSYIEDNYFCTEASVPATEQSHLPGTQECNNRESSDAYIEESYCSEAFVPTTEQILLPQIEKCNNGESSHAYIEGYNCTKAYVTATEITIIPQTEECNNVEACHPYIEESLHANSTGYSLPATDHHIHLPQPHLPQPQLPANKPDSPELPPKADTANQNHSGSTVESTHSQIHNLSGSTVEPTHSQIQNLLDHAPKEQPEHHRFEQETRLAEMPKKACVPQPQLNDLSLRQLRKMLREKLQLQKQRLEREPLQALNQNHRI